jgi:DNA-binding transcriptional ArsR family regulator
MTSLESDSSREPVGAPLPDEALELVAARFKVLAEPMRLRLLNALHNGERSVTALVEATGATQANVSKHLAVLADASMVSRRKEGLNVFYFIADPMVFQLCELVCARMRIELEQRANALGRP